MQARAGGRLSAVFAPAHADAQAQFADVVRRERPCARAVAVVHGGDLAGPGQEVAFRQNDGQRVVGAVGVDVVGVLQRRRGDEFAVFVFERLDVEAAQPPAHRAHAQRCGVLREQQRVFKGELACLAVGKVTGDAQKQFFFAHHAPIGGPAIGQYARKLDAAGGVARWKDILPDVGLIHQRRDAAEHIGVNGELHAVEMLPRAVGIAQALPNLQRLFLFEKLQFQRDLVPRGRFLAVGVTKDDGRDRAQHQQDRQKQGKNAR